MKRSSKKMMLGVVVAALISLPLAAHAASDSEDPLLRAQPSKGTGLIVSGSVLAAIGTAGLAIAGIAAATHQHDHPLYELDHAMMGLTAIAGGLVTSVGLPLLITGIVKRCHYNKWRASYPGAAALVEGLTVAAGPRQAGFAWSYSF